MTCRFIRHALLSSVLCFVLGPGLALAQTDLSVGNVQVPASGTIEVPIILTPATDATAFQVDLTHPAGFVAGTPILGPGAADHEAHVEVIDGTTVRLLVFSRTNALLGAGVSALVPFTVPPATPDGDFDLMPTLPEVVGPGAVVHGGVSLGDGTIEVIPCFLGDLHPDGAGDAQLDLGDYVQALAQVRGGGVASVRYTDCGGLAPGSLFCSGSVVENWCPQAGADGSFDIDDALALRRVVAGVRRISCEPCNGTGVAPAPVPIAGDVTGDDLLNIADVVELLRISVGLVVPTADQELVGDIAPADLVADVTEVEGDDAIDIADVVMGLRGSVGLITLDWSEQRLIVSMPGVAPFAAFSARVSGLPDGVGIPTVEDLPAGCVDASGESGFDGYGDTWAVTCVSSGPDITGVSGTVATFVYRGPQQVDPASITFAFEMIDATFVPTGTLVLTTP
ncbi:MAG: hypothetical protein AAF533_29175 [Acidobacteriota bacterium]